MSDESAVPPGGSDPFDDEGLLSELDAWDRTFDMLHEDAGAPPTAASGAERTAAPEPGAETLQLGPEIKLGAAGPTARVRRGAPDAAEPEIELGAAGVEPTAAAPRPGAARERGGPAGAPAGFGQFGRGTGQVAPPQSGPHGAALGQYADRGAELEWTVEQGTEDPDSAEAVFADGELGDALAGPTELEWTVEQGTEDPAAGAVFAGGELGDALGGPTGAGWAETSPEVALHPAEGGETAGLDWSAGHTTGGAASWSGIDEMTGPAGSTSPPASQPLDDWARSERVAEVSGPFQEINEGDAGRSEAIADLLEPGDEPFPRPITGAPPAEDSEELLTSARRLGRPSQPADPEEDDDVEQKTPPAVAVVEVLASRGGPAGPAEGMKAHPALLRRGATSAGRAAPTRPVGAAPVRPAADAPAAARTAPGPGGSPEAVGSSDASAVRAAAEALFAESAPALELRIDEEFYDDIEIGLTAERGPAAAAPSPSPASSPPSRRTTTHLIRRTMTQAGVAAPDEEGSGGRREARRSVPPASEISGSHRAAVPLAAPAQPTARRSRATFPPPPPGSAERAVLEAEGRLPPAEADERGRETLPPPFARSEAPEERADSDRGVRGRAALPPAFDDDLAPSFDAEDAAGEASAALPPAFDDDLAPPFDAEDAAGEASAALPPAFDDDLAPSFDADDAAGEASAAGVRSRATLPPAFAANRPPASTTADRGGLGAPAGAPSPALEPRPGAGPVEPAGELAPEPDLSLDVTALQLPEQVEVDLADRCEELVEELALYERELALVDEPETVMHLRLAAARTAERLGDSDRAQVHYEECLAVDPRQLVALRGLRRVLWGAGQLTELVRSLEVELQLAGPGERRALHAHRCDLLTACGEQDLARVATGELLSASGSDVRPLLVDLELAYADGRKEEFGEALQRLAVAVADGRLAAQLCSVRGHLAELGDDPAGARAAYGMALQRDGSAPGAVLGAARTAVQQGKTAEAVLALAGLETAAPWLAEADPELTAGLVFRQSLLAREVDPQAEWQALRRAFELGATAPVLLERLCAVGSASGEAELVTAACERLADTAPAVLERAAAQLALAARHADDPARAAVHLASAVQLDPDDLSAVHALRQLYRRSGDAAAQLALTEQLAAREPDPAGPAHLQLLLQLVASGQFAAAQAVSAAALPQARSRPAVALALGEAAEAAADLDGAAGLALALAAGECEFLPPERAQRDAARAAEAAARAAQARGDAEAAARFLKQALGAWDLVIELDGRSLEAHFARLRVAAALGERALYFDLLGDTQGACRHPAAAAVLGMRRVAAQLGADREGAEELLRELLVQEPTDPRATTGLLVLLTQAGRRLEAGLALVDRARALEELGGAAVDAAACRYRAAVLLSAGDDELTEVIALLTSLVAERPAFLPAAELLAAAHRRSGDVGALADLGRMRSTDEAARDARSDAFALLVREAELLEHEVGDLGAAAAAYRKALALRPGDPLARVGYTRVAEAAGDGATLAQLALEALKQAEAEGDAAARAEAYEELAWVDAELRGDRGSALLAWESAALAQPGRVVLWRPLERACLEDGREQELLAVYDGQIGALGEAPDAVPLLVERAFLAERLQRPVSEVQRDLRAICAREPKSRMALFLLEGQLRAQGPSAALATTEIAVADYFDTDERARAAFLTQAGGTLATLGDVGPAIQCFRQACAARGGYVPALTAWQQVALRAGLWLDVAEASSLLAGVASSPAERARQYHLAAVVLMDRTAPGPQAVAALRAALEADPGHEDAFVRLRHLLDREGRSEELAELLQRRLAVEPARSRKVLLHRELAALYRDLFDDRDRAVQELRALLALRPGDLGAVRALSDITWEQGAWAEAAEALVARARLERDPVVLKQIFYRLGTIYAERLPDPPLAIKAFQRVLGYDQNDADALDRLASLGAQTGDWKMALAATERLVKVNRDQAERIRLLHQAARIHEEGFADRAQAERAYRLALDLDPTSDSALAAVVRFYERANDMRSMRVHIDRVVAAMRARLDEDPLDPVAYRVLSRAFEARERSGAVGSLAAAQGAAELACLLGSAEPREEQLATAAGQLRAPIAGLASRDLDELLFPAEAPSGLRELFRLLGDRVVRHVGSDLAQYGVGRGERIKRGSDPAAEIAFDVARALGFDDIDLYVSRKQPAVMAAEPGNPVSLVLGEALVAADRPALLRFASAAALKLAAAQLAVPARMSVDDFGVLLYALVRQFRPDLPAGDLSADAVAAEQQRVRRLIPSSLLQELGPYVVGIAGAGLDHRRVWHGIREAGYRAGLLAAGSLHVALTAALRIENQRDLPAGIARPAIRGLLRFACSEDCVQLRAALERGR
jgi:hypothetical protein